MLTIVGNETVVCCRDKWKWTYHYEPFRQESLDRDFPILPLDYEGNCLHKVGIERCNKFHCCVCGYTVIRR